MTDPRRRQLLGWWALGTLGLGLGLGGCNLLTPPTHIPMDLLRPSGGPCAGRAPTLLVMLPGVRSRPDEFIDEGFVAAVRSRGLAADIVVADAHLGYYEDRSVLRRLRDDVVRPARAAGYRHIWLVGISLGGFGALGYGARMGDEIDGIVALAPYLGRRTLQQEINAAGGPLRWSRTPHERLDDDLEREVWEWMAAGPPARLPVFLGYGREDRFAEAHRLLAGLLPPDRVDSVPGDHDWPAWRALWAHWLERELIGTTCAAAA